MKTRRILSVLTMIARRGEICLKRQDRIYAILNQPDINKEKLGLELTKYEKSVDGYFQCLGREKSESFLLFEQYIEEKMRMRLTA